MDWIISDVTEIKKKPELYQMNASPVETSLEKYIFKGNVCTMDEGLCRAFREVDDYTDYKYFIDLRDFLVEYPSPSEKWGRAEFAYAAVIKINGRNLFFLFIDEE